jgi:hypothetical protein
MSLQKSFRDLSLEEGWKRLLQSKAPGQSAAYQDAVNKFVGGSDLAQKRVGDVLSYARQSPDHTLDIANALTGRMMTRYNPGDIRSVNRDTIHKGVMDEVAYKRFLSSMGIFDSEQYATNPMYNMLPRTSYLESLLPKYQQKVTTAETADAEHQERNSYRVNTWQHWSDMQNRLGEMNENNAPYFWAYADYLLNGDVSKPFDMDSYNNAWDAMDDEQFFADQDAKRAQFDSLDWDKLTDKNASVKDQLYNSDTNSARADFSMIQNEVTRRQTIESLEALARSNPEFASLSVYKDEYVAPERGLFSGNAFEPYVQGMDDLNRFLNVDFGWQTKEIAAQHSIAVRKYLDNGYDFMSDDELAVYNTLYNTDQSKAAEYLEALRPDLLRRRSQVNQTVAEAYATNPVTGAPSFFGAVASSVLRPFQLPQQIYEAATGRDNPYSAAHDLANNAGYVYGAQDAALGEISMPDWMTVNGKNILQHLYGAATSGFENAARIIAAGGNPTVALIFAGLQSGSASLQESAGRDDMSGAAKIIKAIGTAAMEVGTEKIGLDALFNTGRKGALSYIKNVILSEMGEEALNYISEDVIESVVAFLFDHEADIKSGPEFWQGLTDIMIQTALSGDMMGTTGAVTQRIGTSSTGSTLRSRGDIEGVLAIGDSMAAGTDSYTETQAVREKQKAGKKVSNYDLGRAVKAIAKDIGDENSAVVTKVYDEAIEDRLVELGDTVESAKKNAPVIRKMSMGQKLSAMERASVMWSDNATQVVKELTAEQKADTSVGNAAEAEGHRTGQKWRTEMGSTIREKTADLTGKQLRFTEALTRKTSTATATSKAAEKAKKLHGKGTDLTAKNMSFGDTTGEFQKVTKKNGKFFVEVSDGKTTTEAALDDVTSFYGEGLGTVLEYTQEAAHEMTAAEVNTMANAYMETGGDAQSFIANYESAYLSGYSGLEMPSNDLSDGIRAMAYEHGKAEAVIEETKRVTRAAGRRAQKTATTSWLGKVSGGNAIRGTGSVDGLSEALEGMTESQRFVADFASEFGQQTGINIVLFEGVAGSDGKITAQNGSYDSATNTIYLDINSGANTSADLKSQRNSGTLGYALMRTLGHEVTHAIEATSTEFYAKYKQAVKDELKAKGLDWSVLVRQKIDAAVADGKKLTYAGAEAEVVADASEYMLQDSKFVKNLDNSIKGKIKTIIRDFMDKVNTVFRNLTGGHIESAALRESVDGVYHYTKNLQELWDAALDEMVGRETGDVATKQQGPDGEQMEVGSEETVQKIQKPTREQEDTSDVFDEAHPMSRQFSTRQLAESLGYELKMLSGTDVPYAIVDSDGNEVTSFTADQIRNTPIGRLIEAAVAAGNIDPDIQRDQLKMIADLATLAAQYKDQAMVWEIAGSQLYSAIKNNSDKQYNKTVDFGTICSKTQAVVDVLSETMLRLDRGLTREEVITAYNKTAKNGLSVPCGPCYVFSRWMGVPGLLNSMANYQRRFGKMSAEEVTEYIDGVQERYASDGERFSKVIGKQKTKLENRLESIASRMQRAMATGADMTALFREADEVEREYADVEAYNWVTQVLCQNKRANGAVEVLRDSNGIVKIDPAYKPVPHSILFDMRRTGEFAKYPKSWKYRSTRGAGMGKSILPYSGASLGDTVYGEQKRRATSQNAFLNPNMTKAQRVRAIKNAAKRMKSQNLIGGHRFQSTSDYRPEWGLDYIMTFLEMQAVSAKGQLYTKVIEAVDMFASAGIEVNLSIMANGDGWHRDENGNPVLGVEDFSSVSGIDFTEALQKTRDYDNVQMILVGMNDTHIRLALADDRITFVIPWHSSGSSESILKQLFDAVGEELHTGSDYQEIQSDKPVPKPSEKQRQNAALRTKIITGKFAKNLPTEAEREAIEANEFLNDLYTRFYLDPSATDTYGVKLSSEQASQVFPYEYWDTSLTYKDADENGRRFVRYCEDIGLVPRFEKFKEDTGYWKLLIDRRMYNRDGTYHTPAIIDVTGVKIGDIASSVSQAKYGDPAKTGNAVMETIEELRTKAGTPAYPEPSIIETVDGYGDEVEIEARPIQKSTRDLPSEITVRDYLAQSDESAAATIEERNALTIYQKLLKGHADASEKVSAAEQALLTASEEDKPDARKALSAARSQQKDIYNRLLNVERTPHVQSVVKRTNQLMGDLSGKTQSDVERMIADRERTIANLKADITGLKGAVKTQRESDTRENERQIQQLKSKAAQALLKNSEHYQRQIDEIRMRRDMNLEIGKKTHKIRRIVKALNDRITHEEDYKNVKEPLKPAVHRLVQTFIDGFGSLVFDQKQADRLKRIYDEISKEDAAPEFWSDDVSRWIGELADLAEQDNLRRIEGSTSVGALTEKLVVYSQVADIADSIYHMVTAADELFVDGKRMQFDAYTASVGNALLDHKDAKLHTGKARTAFRVWDDLIRTGNMTPQFFFESLKNDGIMSLFNGLLGGQTKYAQAIREGRDFVSEAKRRHNYYTWQNMKKPMAYRTKQGHDIALTVEQAMWVYATAKREASNTIADTHHLEIGGFEYDDKGMPKGIAGINRTHRLNAADVANISNMLTAEQRAYADEMVQYLSEDMAELGNEASMELFGIRKYNEKYYFPFKVSSGQRHQRSDAGSTSTTSDARVKHSSFTHALTRGANTTLVMGNFTDIIADHINQMATYSSFVVPIESMNRVLNRKINDEKDGSGNDVTIRSMIARKYGESAQKYISDLLKDLNGGPQVDNRGGLSALFRAFQRGAVLGSLSVAVQQPTAMIRAFAYINPKYFAHITGEGNKQTWERMMKYSGATVIKDEGKFDIGTSRMVNDWIANSDISDYKIAQRARFLMDTKGWEAVKNNFLETLTALPGVMDRITWTHIWKAVEAEQADQNPGMDRNSDAFLTMVGQRFDDIINHTQVYDSILARSQNMRSKNPLAQMSTAFMSEPTLNMNLFYSAFTGEHSKAQRTGIVASVIGANVLAAAFAAAVSAWNKDDDDRTAAEKYLESFVSKAVDNLNPLTMLPYVSDLWNILNGYDIERTDWSVVVDIVDAGDKFFDKVLNGETVTWKNVEDFFGSVANLTGVPLRNWSRDARRMFNFIRTDKSLPDASAVKYTLYETVAPFGLYKSSNSAYYDRYIAALMDGDKQESYDLREFLTVSKKIGEDKFLSDARGAYKKVYLKGGIKKEAAIKFLMDNNLADSQKSAFGYVDRWEEGSEYHSVYNTLEQAFETGSVSNIQTAWKELTSNGYTDKQVGEQTRTILKGLVQSGKITPSKATELLRKWYPYKKDSDNIDKPKEWLETK